MGEHTFLLMSLLHNAHNWDVFFLPIVCLQDVQTSNNYEQFSLWCGVQELMIFANYTRYSSQTPLTHMCTHRSKTPG